MRKVTFFVRKLSSISIYSSFWPPLSIPGCSVYSYGKQNWVRQEGLPGGRNPNTKAKRQEAAIMVMHDRYFKPGGVSSLSKVGLFPGRQVKGFAQTQRFFLKRLSSSPVIAVPTFYPL